MSKKTTTTQVTQTVTEDKGSLVGKIVKGAVIVTAIGSGLYPLA